MMQGGMIVVIWAKSSITCDVIYVWPLEVRRAGQLTLYHISNNL